MRFPEILLLATLVTAFIWLLDIFWLGPNRIKNRRTGALQQPLKEPWWVEYSKAFFPILLIVFILRGFVIEPFRIPSGSMRPTLLEGDFILVNKYDYGLRFPFLNKTLLKVGTPQRGDVVIFKHDKGEDIDMIKRVIGLPGDKIEYKEKMLYINGEPIKQDFVADKNDMIFGTSATVREMKESLGKSEHPIYVHPGDAPHYAYNNITVPIDSYFVMGDNRDNSKDSRMWGFVKDEEIEGRAFAVWMSWDFDQWKLRWKRMFTWIP